jgi:dTDP-4-amino-4,6-dideoxygalactose transaminase
MKDQINVTQPYLSPLSEFIPYLEKIWESKIVTNSGPFHQEFEEALCKYLGVKYISLFCNATIALLTALQALKISGEVITTPYSFVATTHALRWNNITPVFCDIDLESLNLDPSKIESAITEKTSAIMPVHCYGRPCDTKEIEKIAKKYGLKVIYDSAHAFGVRCDCEDGSLLNYGDLSVLSFHATKVFNTFEGGAIVSPNSEMKQSIDRLKNFGFVGETEVINSGINGKMSEINAAFGLVQLKFIDQVIKKRAQIHSRYIESLRTVRGIRCFGGGGEKQANYAYFPILVTPDFCMKRDDLYRLFKTHHINVRRYFYPLISSFEIYQELPSANKDNLPNSVAAAEQVICLPIYPDLSIADQDRIISIIKDAHKLV